MNTTAARLVVVQAVSKRIFPAAAIDVGSSAGPLWSDAIGTTTFESRRLVTLQTPFDLASLTKPIATASIAMELVRLSFMQLDDPVAGSFPEWSGTDREGVTVQDLLEHASGLPARLFDRPPTQRREFEHEICTMPLEYAPRFRSVYSDLGFILLAFLAADRGRKSFARLFDDVAGRISAQSSTRDRDSDVSLRFGPIADAAPTMPLGEDVRRGRMLVGQVHDNYAAALGGVAGHAGLFGTAAAVGAFARMVLRASRGDASVPPPWTPGMVARFTTKSTVPGSSRALGWDTMLPTSSCGTNMSRSAFGHVGFTGTSLWIDPERDRYFVLLTNRACGGGSLDQMRDVRRAFHDALV
ncbi:MAG TPA: serine hydrolase domain-containing protein [Vicinamibacterales bacterium]